MTEERTRYRILLEDEKYSVDLRTYNDRETTEHHEKLHAQITGGKTSVFQEVYYNDY